MASSRRPSPPPTSPCAYFMASDDERDDDSSNWNSTSGARNLDIVKIDEMQPKSHKQLAAVDTTMTTMNTTMNTTGTVDISVIEEHPPPDEIIDVTSMVLPEPPSLSPSRAVAAGFRSISPAPSDEQMHIEAQQSPESTTTDTDMRELHHYSWKQALLSYNPAVPSPFATVSESSSTCNDDTGLNRCWQLAGVAHAWTQNNSPHKSTSPSANAIVAISPRPDPPSPHYASPLAFPDDEVSEFLAMNPHIHKKAKMPTSARASPQPSVHSSCDSSNDDLNAELQQLKMSESLLRKELAHAAESQTFYQLTSGLAVSNSPARKNTPTPPSSHSLKRMPKVEDVLDNGSDGDVPDTTATDTTTDDTCTTSNDTPPKETATTATTHPKTQGAMAQARSTSPQLNAAARVHEQQAKDHKPPLVAFSEYVTQLDYIDHVVEHVFGAMLGGCSRYWGSGDSNATACVAPACPTLPTKRKTKTVSFDDDTDMPTVIEFETHKGWAKSKCDADNLDKVKKSAFLSSQREKLAAAKKHLRFQDEMPPPKMDEDEEDVFANLSLDLSLVDELKRMDEMKIDSTARITSDGHQKKQKPAMLDQRCTDVEMCCWTPETYRKWRQQSPLQWEERRRAALLFEQLWAQKRRFSQWNKSWLIQQKLLGVPAVGWLAGLSAIVLIALIALIVALSTQAADAPYLHLFPAYTQEKILQDPLSAQARAYEWLIQDPSLTDYSDQRRVQRFALATLYFSTNGDEWSLAQSGITSSNSSRWLSYGTDECQWQASESFLSHRACPVPGGSYESLSLDYSNLKGTLPNELGLLSHLQFLSLMGNSFHESNIPQELLTGLTNLMALDLSQSGLMGTIPSSIGLLSRLGVLDLSENSLKGCVPVEMEQLAHLKELRLHRNELNGTLSGRLANSWVQLEALYLFENDLSGALPTEIGSMKELEDLFLYRNGLSSSLPTELGQLPQLQRIWLDRNTFEGSIPSELGVLAHLKDLNLYSNKLSGTIPKSLANAASLEQVLLDQNHLSGEVPRQLCSIIPFDPDNQALRMLSVDCAEVVCNCNCRCPRPANG